MVGVDVVKIERIERALKSKHFSERVYTAAEREYCDGKAGKAESYAGIYAAKEAVGKALGVGLNGLNFHDIEVFHDANGAPEVSLSGRAAKLVGERKVHLSVSHDGGIAVAFCVLEK